MKWGLLKISLITFFYDNPKVFFMHIGGRGEMEKIALAVRKALDKIKAIRNKSPQPARGFEGLPVTGKNSIMPQSIENILGVKGEAKQGMFKAVLARKTKMP